jgi:hypothetical protein
MLVKALRELGVSASVMVSGPEENSIDTSVASLEQWDKAAIDAISVVTTHTYGGTRRAELAAFAVGRSRFRPRASS